MTTNDSWPTGTITFLFTDMEKSTLLWERYSEKMRPVLARHDAILRAAIEEHGGRVVKTTGDGFHAVFETAVSALLTTLDAQAQLAADPWPEIAPDVLRVRMGIHSGEAQWRDGDYYGPAVNRAARIMGLGHGGQVLLSAVSASLLQDSLPPQTSLRDMREHQLRSLQHAEHIYQLVAPDLQREFPPLHSSKTPAGNLPTHVNSFIGRTRELSEIRKALPHTRLLTLTGPGGTGKTRLSLQVARDMQSEFDQGAWLVELAPVTDPELVVTTAAGVFGLDGQTKEQTKAAFFDYLREKELLLLLDNCEHLIESCARLANDLITICPRVTILASSREGLGVYGETTYHLPTLNLPAGNEATAESAGRSEAVQLFVERAVAAQPRFRLSDTNAQFVVQVVRRLDGIPLAIELAAARLRIFSIEQVAARLDQRFRLLTGGSRTAMPRQQTLRALIDWSYDLLDQEERDLFNRLSVFRGGWTFDAAEFMAGPLDAYILLPQLVSKSLVTREVDASLESAPEDAPLPNPRFFYLETIRQYARDRLVESGTVQETRDRHFAYYEALAASVEFGSGPGAAMLQAGQIILEQDNLRAAVEWGIDCYPWRTLDLLWNLTPYLSDQMPGSESIDWVTSALEHLDTLTLKTDDAGQQHKQARYKGLVMLCMLKLFMGQLDEATRISNEVIGLLQHNDHDPFLLAMALFVKAQSGFFLEALDFDETVAQAEAVLRRMVDHPARGWMLSSVLLLLAESEGRKGDLQMVKRYLQESTAVLEDAVNISFLPWLEYASLLIMLEMEYDPQLSRQQYEKTVKRLRQRHAKRMAAMIESDWAHKMHHEGNLDEALVIYRRMLVEWRKLGHRAAVANILENIAFVERGLERPALAAILLGAAHRIREEIDQDMLHTERRKYDSELAAIKSSLTPPELDRLWAEGYALSTDSAIALALKTGNSVG